MFSKKDNKPYLVIHSLGVYLTDAYSHLSAANDDVPMEDVWTPQAGRDYEDFTRSMTEILYSFLKTTQN